MNCMRICTPTYGLCMADAVIPVDGGAQLRSSMATQ